MKRMKGLSEFLQEVPDYRRAQGIRVSMPAVLTIIILGFMSGSNSMQSLRRFMKNNKSFFIEKFNLQNGVPSYAQIPTILSSIDFKALNTAFCNWANQFIEYDFEQWLSVDCKGLNSTIKDAHGSNQDFQAMVSIFINSQGITLSADNYSNKNGSELITAQELIARLENKGMILTLDALHCQKKRRKLSWAEEMTM